MKVIADLHIHSKYSRATSMNMNIETIARYAEIKGLNLVGTGDFSHPKFLKELKESLRPIEETGLYQLKSHPESPVRFMITTEVCTIFEFDKKVRKVHHVILTPSLDIAEQINDRLSKWGDLSIDGRPSLNIDAPSLVEEVMSISNENEVFPAHCWTPWYSIFGAFSGFDSVEECYQDMTKHIHALETGLSSDPPMNWRVSSLDQFTLLSNSDSHSPWTWRLGREANVFEVKEFTYREIIDIIRRKDSKRFLFTIETDPAYGKYHWDGHRACNVSLPPFEAIKLRNICPKCGKKLTKGVEHRVEELSDRPYGFKPEGAIPFIRLFPLSEIVATIRGTSVQSKESQLICEKLIRKFGNEYSVLIEASKEDLLQVTDPDIAEAIIRVREGKVKVKPGYDGVYGKLIFEEEEMKPIKLEDFLRKLPSFP